MARCDGHPGEVAANELFGLATGDQFARIFSGAGAGPMLAAAAAWDQLAGELGSAATAFSSVTSALVSSSWQARRRRRWQASPEAISDGCPRPERKRRRRVVRLELPRPRSRRPRGHGAPGSGLGQPFSAGVAGCLRPAGFHAPAIAAVEAAYEQMWAQDVAAMFGYHAGASAAASALTPFIQLVQNPSPPVRHWSRPRRPPS
ncbi:PPE family protein [Mycobacterium kansasii 732]|nr:PPE family protein [Mycobacterium kansasii 732]